MTFPDPSKEYLPKEAGNPLPFYIRGTEVVVYPLNLSVPLFDCELNQYVTYEKDSKNE